MFPISQTNIKTEMYQRGGDFHVGIERLGEPDPPAGARRSSASTGAICSRARFTAERANSIGSSPTRTRKPRPESRHEQRWPLV
jgi:hypothetical protein